MIGFDLSIQRRTVLNNESFLESSRGALPSVPVHHFKSAVKVSYISGYVYLPFMVDGFLTHIYGDWKAPVKNVTVENCYAFKESVEYTPTVEKIKL